MDAKEEERETHRFIVEIVYTAVEVGRLAHECRHVLRGRHIEEWTPIYVRRVEHFISARRYLVVADAVIVQQLWNLVEGRILMLLLLVVLLWFIVDCVLVLGYLY